MKAEDFLTALNEADDSFVKKAGRKAGYFSAEPVTDTGRTEAVIQIQGMRQETAKQRNAKRIMVAAACLALAALSWGGWLLLRQNLPGRAEPGTEQLAGSTQTQSKAASAAVTTEEASSAESPGDPVVVDRKEVNLIWVGDRQVRCFAGVDPSQAVMITVQNDSLLPNIPDYTLNAASLNEEEQEQLLEQAKSGMLHLQKGFGTEIAARAALDPERVAVVRMRWILSDGFSHTETIKMVQIFFTVQDEDGFWRILDATDRQNAEVSELSEEDVAQMLEQYGIFLGDKRITYTPSTDAYKTMNSLLTTVQALHPDTGLSAGKVGAYGGAKKEIAINLKVFKTMPLQNGKNAEIVEMLEAGSEDIKAISWDYTYYLERANNDSLPQHFSIHQVFFLTRNDDGLWIILDASFPE